MSPAVHETASLVFTFSSAVIWVWMEKLCPEKSAKEESSDQYKREMMVMKKFKRAPVTDINMANTWQKHVLESHESMSQWNLIWMSCKTFINNFPDNFKEYFDPQPFTLDKKVVLIPNIGSHVVPIGPWQGKSNTKTAYSYYEILYILVLAVYLM